MTHTWMLYTILIAIFFAFIKSVNYRLHKLFGTDPPILKEEETAKEEHTHTHNTHTHTHTHTHRHTHTNMDEMEATENKEKTTDDGKRDVPELDVKPYPTKTDEAQTDIDVNVEVHKSAQHS